MRASLPRTAGAQHLYQHPQITVVPRQDPPTQESTPLGLPSSPDHNTPLLKSTGQFSSSSQLPVTKERHSAHLLNVNS